MAIARFGSLFAIAAFVLLLFNINGQQLGAGTYGYCLGNVCSPKTFGYGIDDLLDQITGNTETIRGNIQRGLTKAIGVVNPAATGLALLAAIFAVFGGLFSHILGSIIAFFAFLVSIVALGLNLGLFIAARHRINSNFQGSPASLGNAMWLLLAGTICLLIAALTVCCGGIRDRRANKHDSYNNAAPVTAERPGRFDMFRRNRQPVAY